MKKNRRYSSVENKDEMSGEELLTEDIKEAALGGENTEAEAELAEGAASAVVDSGEDCAQVREDEVIVDGVDEILSADGDESMTDENIVAIGEADEAVIVDDEEQSEAVESGEAESDADSEGDEIAERAEVGDSVEDDGDAEEEEKESESVSFAEKLFNFTELLVFTLAAVVLLLSFVFRHAEVIGSSMDTTLANGEHLIISDLFYTPERGDIIVFEDHSTIYKKPLIKRVIAVGGDHIRIKNGVVHLNGALLDESAYIRGAYTMGNVDMIVPDGEVFVMGDNRGASDDSRNNLIGTIDEDAILGKVILRFFPFDSFGSVN